MNRRYNDTSGYSRLFLAVHNGEINVLPSLLEKHSATDAINGKTLINVAAARGHVEIVRMLMKTDTDVNTLLNIAIKENQPSVFHLLIKECDVNVKDCKDLTALHYAAEYDRVEFAKILIENGANVDIPDIDGRTRILKALVNKNFFLVDTLFQDYSRAVLTVHDKKPHLLKLVAVHGNLEMIKLLTKHGWNNINILLKIAVACDRLDVVEYLMNSVSKSSGIITHDDLNLYSICIECYSINSLKYLIDSGIKSRRIMLNNQVLLQLNKVGKYLLTCRSKIITDFSETQLHSAVRAGELETVRAIVNQQRNIVEMDSFACKLAVYMAIENGNADILQVLLDAGYSMKSCFDEISPVHLAATYEDPRLLELLLKAGADINSETEDCLTPLHFAALATRSKVVQFLLENGANPSNGNNKSSLSYALKGFSFIKTVTSSLFTNLVEITKILILQNTDDDFCKLLSRASRIKVYNDEKQNTKFCPDLVRCIFNYLTDECIKYCSQSLLNDVTTSFNITPEFLHLLMEYDDSKSCDSIVLYEEEFAFIVINYRVKLLLIDYSRNTDNLLNSAVSLFTDSYQDEVEITVLAKLLIARLVLLTDSEDARMSKFCPIHELLDWHRECRMQKESMQNTPVADDFKVTFHDVLTEPLDIVANYVRNENFDKIIESSYEKFPAFSKFLKIRIERAMRRKNLREECTNAMYNLIKGNHKIELLDDHLDQIFQYLSAVDLRRFSAAFL